MSRTPVALIALVTAALAAGMSAEGQGGFGRRPVFSNESVSVERLLLLPGSLEGPHTHGYPMIVVQLTAGTAETQNGEAVIKGARAPGTVEFISSTATHASANVGSGPFEVLTISINPERLRGGTAPPAPAPAGVTRTPIFDNADATTARLDFAPSSRETVHMHPYDLVVVPLTTSRIELQVGSEKEMRNLSPGDAFFIPRFEPHAMANIDSGTLSVLGIVIK
jgi:quercetin dioxygenase-like cupin family protein